MSNVKPARLLTVCPIFGHLHHGVIKMVHNSRPFKIGRFSQLLLDEEAEICYFSRWKDREKVVAIVEQWRAIQILVAFNPEGDDCKARKKEVE